MFGDDEELHRLLHVVHDVVEDSGTYYHVDKTEDEATPVAEDEV